MTTQQQTVAQPIFAEPHEYEGATRGLWSDAWRRLIKNKLAVVSIVLLVTVAFIAFAAPHISALQHHEPSAITTDKHYGPGSEHWFGTDQLGRDLWARCLEGIRISLTIGLGVQVVVLSIGLIFGIAAALGGRFTDNIVMRFTDIMYAFPQLLFVILIREILFHRDIPGLTNTLVIILAIGLLEWTTIARLIRGQMLSLNERDFVMAARALGAPRWRIVVQHMLPNTLGPVIVAITFGIPTAIFVEAILGFLGLGIPKPTVSLGYLVADGYATIQRNIWTVIFPSAALAMLMLCFTFLGDGLRDALDPRTR
jgi:oligopeptide transport system permease protein